MRPNIFNKNMLLLAVFIVTLVVLLSVVTGFVTVTYNYWVRSTDVKTAVSFSVPGK